MASPQRQAILAQWANLIRFITSPDRLPGLQKHKTCPRYTYFKQKVIKNILKSKPARYEFTKILKGFCWHFQKTKSQIALQLIYVTSNLSTLSKDMSQTVELTVQTQPN